MEKPDFKLEFLARCSYCAFSVNGDVYYMRDIMLSHLFKLENGSWSAIPYSENPELLGESLMHDEGESLCRKYPPFEAMDALEGEEALKQRDEMEKRIATTTRKVIGWEDASEGTIGFVEAEDPDDDVIAAIVKDIRDHGYFFTGEDHQDAAFEHCSPVMDDYLCYSFSRRNFAWIMAMGNGLYDRMSYALFTDAELIEDDEKRFPPSTMTLPNAVNPPYAFEVPPAQLERIEASLPREPSGKFPVFLFPISGTQGHYWRGDKITLNSEEKTLNLKVFGIYNVANRDVFDYLISRFDNSALSSAVFDEGDLDGEWPKLFLGLWK